LEGVEKMVVRVYKEKKIVHCHDCPFYHGGMCDHDMVKEEKRWSAKANNYLCPLKEVNKEIE
jgi:predicted transcriptional regulator of viral defense system